MKWKHAWLRGCTNMRGIPCACLIPGLPGVYAFIGRTRNNQKHKQILYIGSAKHLRSRLHVHMKNNGSFTRDFVFMTGNKVKHAYDVEIRYSVEPDTKAGRWLSREFALITRIKPPLNEMHTKRERT